MALSKSSQSGEFRQLGKTSNFICIFISSHSGFISNPGRPAGDFPPSWVELLPILWCPRGHVCMYVWLPTFVQYRHLLASIPIDLIMRFSGKKHAKWRGSYPLSCPVSTDHIYTREIKIKIACVLFANLGWSINGNWIDRTSLDLVVITESATRPCVAFLNEYMGWTHFCSLLSMKWLAFMQQSCFVVAFANLSWSININWIEKSYFFLM